ncbi:MAG: hypothetical protein ACJA16_002848, partial [Akkermansiaceae bacterium]
TPSILDEVMLASMIFLGILIDVLRNRF